jgi:2-hydroxycyclohexanecarboxyl-CoA dehydrogenase
VIDLSGKVVMIAGASGGIGSHVAEVFIECGASVALAFRTDSPRMEEVRQKMAATGKPSLSSQVDMTRIANVMRWTQSVIEEFGEIDVVINCCGSNDPFTLLRDQDPSRWSSIIEIELMSTVYLSKAVADHMTSRKQGRIISLGSDSSKVGNSGVAISAAARGGLNAFSKSLARELARFGVTVNTVCPGPTQTPAWDKQFAQGEVGEKIVTAMLRAVPLRKAGDPRDIGWLMAFLASDHGGHITGQALSISGGLTMC